jgi:RHS repeat-associated protein
MLIRVEVTDAHAKPLAEWEACYDALGRRIWARQAGKTREFYWDHDRLAAEILPDQKLRIYVYATLDSLTPLAFTEYASKDADPASGTTYHVFSNQVGMPLCIEDDKGQVVWWAERIHPYGAVQIRPESKIEYNLRWPGHYYDPETNLHYNRYRYYDPKLGRYLQTDPVGYGGSQVNLYSYCPNPLVQVDVLGLAHEGDTDGSPGSKEGATDTDGTEKTKTDAGDSTKPHSDYPPRTAEARAQAKHVTAVVDSMTGPGSRSVVTVFTHADGTVSVGLSGANGKKKAEFAKQLEQKLNKGHKPPKYRVAPETMPVESIKETPTGNKPGACAEPAAVNAANKTDSPITGMDTRWRGEGDNPHPFKGENADGAPVEPSQMHPCDTCNDPDNIDAYMDHAHGNNS